MEKVEISELYKLENENEELYRENTKLKKDLGFGFVVPKIKNDIIK